MTNGNSKRLSHSLKSYSKKPEHTRSQLVVEATSWHNSFRRKFGCMHQRSKRCAHSSTEEVAGKGNIHKYLYHIFFPNIIIILQNGDQQEELICEWDIRKALRIMFSRICEDTERCPKYVSKWKARLNKQNHPNFVSQKNHIYKHTKTRGRSYINMLNVDRLSIKIMDFKKWF